MLQLPKSLVKVNEFTGESNLKPTPEGEMTDQASLEHIAQEGVGALYQFPNNGPFVVFSQFPLDHVPNKNEKKFIFLVGPTPDNFQGKFEEYDDDIQRARFWRRDLLAHIEKTENAGLTDEYVLVLPEPAGGHWMTTDFPGLKWPKHIARQILWEKSYLDKTKETGTVVMYVWPRWKLKNKAGELVDANAGPTTRLEVGEYINTECKRVLWVPSGDLGTQTADWVSVRAKLRPSIKVYEAEMSAVGLTGFYDFVIKSIK